MTTQRDDEWTCRDVPTKVKPSFYVLRGHGGGMPNERLRALLLERGVTPAKLSEAVQVDPKTIERWIVAGRRALSSAPLLGRRVLWCG